MNAPSNTRFQIRTRYPVKRAISAAPPEDMPGGAARLQTVSHRAFQATAQRCGCIAYALDHPRH